MTRAVRRAVLMVAVLAGVGCSVSVKSSGVNAGAGTGVVPAAPPALRVMSFNIRYDTPSDGANGWPNRKDWVASLIRFHEADAIGVQEALARQLTDLDARLPGFARVGVGRADGKAAGEFSAIFYRTDRLELIDSGTFWLSQTPEVAGSKGWDTAIERIATWARFRDRQSGCRFVHLNTHFDHMGEEARRESARLIRRRLVTLSGGLPYVVTGDLNAAPTSVPYRRRRATAHRRVSRQPRRPLWADVIVDRVPCDRARAPHRLRDGGAVGRCQNARDSARQLGRPVPIGSPAGAGFAGDRVRTLTGQSATRIRRRR
jgi:endonuclease/exonuclease/phosphatase family metal-dependent hydrolase